MYFDLEPCAKRSPKGLGREGGGVQPLRTASAGYDINQPRELLPKLLPALKARHARTRRVVCVVTTTQCSPTFSRRSPAGAIGWAKYRQGLPSGGFHHQNVRLHTAWYRWRLGQADREGGATLLPARGTDTCLALRRLSTVALQRIHCDRKFAWCLALSADRGQDGGEGLCVRVCTRRGGELERTEREPLPRPAHGEPSQAMCAAFS